MNLQRLHETLETMSTLDRSLKLQVNLEAIRDNLTNIVSAPAQPTYQSGLATALSAFTESCSKLTENLTPEDFRLIAELGGAEYFEPSLAASIKTQIAANAMTPSIPRDAIQDLTAKRSGYLDTVRSTLTGLAGLGITGYELPAGAADLAFAIPREIFDNKLGEFAKELEFINRLMAHLSEAITGNPEVATLENLSSTTPTIAIGAGIKIISALADLVGKFLDAWQKIEKFRAARQQLTELGLSGKAIEEVSDQITSTIEEVVEESVEVTLSAFPGEAGRRNELSNALTQDTRRLFGQLERGLTIQFRANPDEESSTEDTTALKAINEAGHTFSFPAVQAEPMLLTAGVVLDGDVPAFKYVKKTTTKRTTTTKAQAK